MTTSISRWRDTLPPSIRPYAEGAPLAEGERLRDGGLTRLSGSGRDRAHGTGFNVSPRLNWKLGDDETLTLQGFFVQQPEEVVMGQR